MIYVDPSGHSIIGAAKGFAKKTANSIRKGISKFKTKIFSNSKKGTASAINPEVSNKNSTASTDGAPGCGNGYCAPGCGDDSLVSESNNRDYIWK